MALPTLSILNSGVTQLSFKIGKFSVDRSRQCELGLTAKMQTGRQTDRWTDRQTSRQTDRQTDR